MRPSLKFVKNTPGLFKKTQVMLFSSLSGGFTLPWGGIPSSARRSAISQGFPTRATPGGRREREMKIEHVNPFVEATVQTFKSMCRVEPVRDGKLEKREAGFMSTYDLLGIIGLSGTVKGAVLMTMDVSTGQKAVGAFLMDEIKEPNADLMDGFGELLNIIAGAAAAKLEGYKVNLAIPTVMIGTNQQMHAKHGSPWVIIPMKFPEWGKFNIEVSLEEV